MAVTGRLWARWWLARSIRWNVSPSAMQAMQDMQAIMTSTVSQPPDDKITAAHLRVLMRAED